MEAEREPKAAEVGVAVQQVAEVVIPKHPERYQQPVVAELPGLQHSIADSTARKLRTRRMQRRDLGHLVAHSTGRIALHSRSPRVCWRRGAEMLRSPVRRLAWGSCSC